MALLITTSGIVSHIMPENGTFFRRDELSRLINSTKSITESLKRRGRNMTFVTGDDGDSNSFAEILYNAMGGCGTVKGNVLVCEKTQIL